MPTIKFTDVTDLVPDIFRPVPAKLHIPEWLKHLPPYIQNDKGTAKRCLPMMDAVMSGYVILLDQDIKVTRRDGLPYYEWQNGKAIDWHPVEQANTHAKIDRVPIPKVISPWAIETPPGYSCLFTQPMNQDRAIIRIFDGIVDTDTYHNPVNFPFMLIDPEWIGVLPAGMPIAQIIPFKREDWVAEYPTPNPREVARNTRLLHSFFKNGYRKLFRADKSFR